MTPIDFVLFNGDSTPNLPVVYVAEAMQRPLRILSADKEFEVCSYYFDDGEMVLELKERSDD
jgi:hypothetical protein